MERTIFTSLALCIALVLAGCSGFTDGQTPTETPTTAETTTTDVGTTPDPLETVRIDLTGNGTYTVTATVVGEENDGIRVYYTDGSAKTYPDVAARGDLPADALDGASRVEPTVGGPGASFTTSGGGGGVFEWPTSPSVLIYSVSDDADRLLGWNYVDCDDGSVREIDIDVNEDGHVSAGHSCTR